VLKAGLLAACCFWPGSEAPIQDLRPTYYLPYNDDLPNDQRVAQVVEWLSLGPGQRPAFITVYFSTVDSAGHSYGPDSLQVRALHTLAPARPHAWAERRVGPRYQVNTALSDVDTVIGYLLGNLTVLGIADTVCSPHTDTDTYTCARAYKMACTTWRGAPLRRPVGPISPVCLVVVAGHGLMCGCADQCGDCVGPRHDGRGCAYARGVPGRLYQPRRRRCDRVLARRGHLASCWPYVLCSWGAPSARVMARSSAVAWVGGRGVRGGRCVCTAAGRRDPQRQL
jgi:hypothetical protein